VRKLPVTSCHLMHMRSTGSGSLSCWHSNCQVTTAKFMGPCIHL
jgi:hypothetical protein